MIEKINFRDQVRNLLLQKMRKNEIDPEKSISLASLAREMDVSVTPIREALTQLQASGVVVSIPNRGFFIPKPTAAEGRNLYELVVSLECLAVRNSVFSTSLIRKLIHTNQAYKRAKNELQRINADMDFHSLITSNYKNPTALKILSDLKIRIFFYEINFMSQESYYSDSGDEHDLIIKYLSDKNIEKACNILTKNWLKASYLQQISLIK